MKNSIWIISIIILAILGFVIKDRLFSIDIVRTKKMALQREYLSKVHTVKKYRHSIRRD